MTIKEAKDAIALQAEHSVNDLKFINSTIDILIESIANKLRPEITDHLTCGNEQCFYDGEWCYHLTDKEFNEIFK